MANELGVKLGDLVATEHSIRGLTQWLGLFADEAQKLARVWRDASHAAPASRKLVMLYAANDVMQTHRQGAGADLAHAFKRQLPDQLHDMGKHCDDKTKKAAVRVIKVLADRRCVSRPDCVKLLSILERPEGADLDIFDSDDEDGGAGGEAHLAPRDPNQRPRAIPTAAGPRAQTGALLSLLSHVDSTHLSASMVTVRLQGAADLLTSLADEGHALQGAELVESLSEATMELSAESLEQDVQALQTQLGEERKLRAELDELLGSVLGDQGEEFSAASAALKVVEAQAVAAEEMLKKAKAARKAADAERAEQARLAREQAKAESAKRAAEEKKRRLTDRLSAIPHAGADLGMPSSKRPRQEDSFRAAWGSAPAAPVPGYAPPAAAAYAAPASQEYGAAPAPQGYGAPPPAYGAPPAGYGAPPPGYPEPQGYGAPPPGYGAPPPAYGAPPPGYGAPPPGYPEPQGYGAPPPGYGAPPPVQGYGDRRQYDDRRYDDRRRR